MSPTVTGIIGIGVLLIVLFSRIPIGLGMALVGFAGFAFISGMGPALGVLRQVPFEIFSEYNLSVVPLFILMGSFSMTAGLSEDLYRVAYRWLGHLKGGLSMATVGACAFFAAISGSSVATAATMATVALPEMRRYKYAPSLATGSIAAGGSIGILIPPSVILIIYGVIAEQSIGKLFLAGFIPGVLEAVFYIFTIVVLVQFNPNLGPRGPQTSLREKTKALVGVWEVVLLFICVIGGIYAGVFTPTEAAGVGAFGAFFFALIRKRLTWPNFKESVSDTTKNTGMVFIIILGAMILGYFLSITQLPFEMASFIAELPVNRYIILVCILLLLAMLGCIMDSMAIVLLTVPIFFPVIMHLNFDPIWFGILVVRVTEMGLITPPVGINVYIIKGISNEPMGTIFRGVFPFIIADILHIALLMAVPQVTLFLPGMMI
jgi:tripartite ATP-independent transporter DctM subunit